MGELMEQVHPQVYRVPARFANGVAEIYVLLGKQVALVDTGVLGSIPQYVEPALAALNLGLSDVELVINTHAHPDHIGGNEVVKRLGIAKFAVHAADVPFTAGPEAFPGSRYDISELYRLAGREDLIVERRAFLLANVGKEVKPDRQLQDGDELDLGRRLVLRVLHTPGHTPGSISLYWEREGILFIGDAMQGRGNRPGWMPLYFDAADYMRSAARLCEVPVRTLCLGHGYQTGTGYNLPVRKGEDAERMPRESLEVAKLIDNAVAETLAEGERESFLAFAKAVLARLQYDMPVTLDRALGVPSHSLASIHAHYILKSQGGDLSCQARKK
jgi:glyoxylase-like metal-dependent hydrolase (beta-lactamase superfamily II)